MPETSNSEVKQERLESPDSQAQDVGASKASDFQAASQQRAANVFVEFTDFLMHNKKWWLTPIILVLMLFSVFIALTSTALAPFIYVLF